MLRHHIMSLTLISYRADFFLITKIDINNLLPNSGYGTVDHVSFYF